MGNISASPSSSLSVSSYLPMPSLSSNNLSFGFNNQQQQQNTNNVQLAPNQMFQNFYQQPPQVKQNANNNLDDFNMQIQQQQVC